MTTQIANGTIRAINGIKHIYYDGYWIKYYETPQDGLQAKKQLIGALTRRLFNHVEHGINIPGARLDEVRASYDAETDMERRRVKGAMLAGALFNRAADIFTQLVDLQAQEGEIDCNGPLMTECGQCLREALILGKMVLHRSGDEGIDELWGEPFRAFSIPVEAFYESRYIKISQALKEIDQLTTTIIDTFSGNPVFSGVESLIRTLGTAAKNKCQTLRTDKDIFDQWTDFVVASEHLTSFRPKLTENSPDSVRQLAADGKLLLLRGNELISYVTRARVTMPKSSQEYIASCHNYAAHANSVFSDESSI